MKNRKQRRRVAPFTLIEVMVVIVILVTLAGIGTPLIMKNIGKSNTGAAKLQIQAFEQAIDSYRLDVGHYPQTLQDLVTNEEQAPNWNGPYMKSIPRDPWGMEYQYSREGVHNQTTFDLYSLGADNMEGGEGENADITNWPAEAENTYY